MKKEKENKSRCKKVIIGLLIAPAIMRIAELNVERLYMKITSSIRLNSLKISESFVSVLSRSEELGTLDYNNGNKDYMSKGCMLNTYIENVTDKNIAISKYKLVVDSIKPFEMPTADIFSICKDNQLSLYVVNNGNIKLENAKVQLIGNYRDNGQTESIQIGNSMLSSVIDTRDDNNEIKIPEIEAGQILKFATLEMSVDNFERNKKVFGSIWIEVKSFIDDKEGTEIGRYPLGNLVNHDGNLDIVLGIGGEAKAIKRQVMIKLNKKTPYDISLRTEFKIGASDTEYLQTYIFTEETCEPTFHLEIKTAGKNYLVTKPVTQKIFIPLYDDMLYLYKIKRWVEENSIENYQYNDNPSLQKEIEYNIEEDYLF